jgi:hypothetical protein
MPLLVYQLMFRTDQLIFRADQFIFRIDQLIFRLVYQDTFLFPLLHLFALSLDILHQLQFGRPREVAVPKEGAPHREQPWILEL